MVSEGIDVPGNIRNVVEGVLQPSKPDCHLIDEVLVVHACFIGHAPATVDELQLTLGNEVFHATAFFVGCLIPPSIEEGHLDDRELIFRMLC